MAMVAPKIKEIVEDASTEVLDRAVKNLSGPRIHPSIRGTENSAIGKEPVPRRTSALVHSMKDKKIIPSIHAVYADTNIAPHAKFVHDGTKKMRPRRFLFNVIRERRQAILNRMNYAFLSAARKIGRT